jgi:hypothetical protein
MTATIETEGEQAQRERIARLRGIRFLAAHALAAGDATAFHVGCEGEMFSEESLIFSAGPGRLRPGGGRGPGMMGCGYRSAQFHGH